MGMKRLLSFRADPPPPYHTLEYHLKKAKRQKYFEPWIDTQTRQEIVTNTANNLNDLLDIPNDFRILFLNNVLPLNKALYDMSAGNMVVANTSNIQQSFQGIVDSYLALSIDSVDIQGNGSKELPLFCFGDIEPLTGEKINISQFDNKQRVLPGTLLHCDVSFSVPIDHLDFQRIHSFYFNTQFGFGTLPGMGVWIVKNNVFDDFKLAYSHDIKATSFKHVNYDDRSILYEVDIDKMYAFGMVAADMLHRGIKIIRNETIYKSIIIRKALEESSGFEPLITDIDHQSKSIICGRTMTNKQEVVNSFLSNDVELDVYSDTGESSIIRIANYPAHSKEQVEYLADLLARF